MAGDGWKRVLNTLQARNDYSLRPAGLAWRSNTFFIVATVAIGLFTDLFLYGLIVPVLPFMLVDRVGLPQDQVQGYVSGLLAAYAGASVVFSPLAGVLADRMSSRQAPFLMGLFTLLASTVLLFLARTVGVLILARILQGVSAAFVWTIGLALCLETVGPKNLGKTIGSIFSFIAVGNFAAPLLGGVMYEKTGYGSVCALALSMIAVDFVMRLLVIEKKIARKYEADDPDAVTDLNTTAEDPEAHEQNRDEDQPASEEQPLLGGKSDDNDDDATFKLSEKRSKLAQMVPIVPCLADPRLLTAFLVALVQAILLGAFDSTVPTVASDLFGFNALQAGILFLPLGGFDLLLGPFFGWAVDRFGTKPVAVISYTFLVPVLVLLRLPHAGGTNQTILYGGLLALCGIGLAGIGAPSIVEAGSIVQRYYEVNPDFFGENGPYAQLYGLSNMVFGAGLTLGPELAGQVKEAIGYGNMNIILAVICALTALLCFIYIGGTPTMMKTRKR